MVAAFSVNLFKYVVHCSVAFPNAEIRCVERDGTSEVVYSGIVPRTTTAPLGIHSGTDQIYILLLLCS